MAGLRHAPRRARLVCTYFVALAWFAARAQAEPDTKPQADAPADDAGAFPILRDDGRPSPSKDALVLVVEGMEGIIRPAVLRARLSSVFGRPVIALSDTDSDAARATLWLAADDKQVTLRLSTPPRADLWQRLPRAKLGADPGATLINALLDMLWSERMKPVSEMRDPFCAPGMVCEAEGEEPVRRPAEQTVLDPWDPAYARFDRGARASTRGEAWDNEPPAPSPQQPPGTASPAAPGLDGTAARVPAAPHTWAIAALVGGGVHQAGGFARYEVNTLRRFPHFDIGLTFVGGRGQPNAADARRAVAALGQYRWISPGLEIDLGVGFGLLVAEQAHAGAEVRPYLRGLGVFAIETGSPIAVLLQSELGTTFTAIASTGAFEYALSLGARYGF
jgi:hypothetical protein